jgi:hypothetical protein
VTVVDITPPVISDCPADISVNSEDVNPLTCSQVVSWTEPTAADNCDGTVAIFSQTHQPGDVFAEGTTEVTYVNIRSCALPSLIEAGR